MFLWLLFWIYDTCSHQHASTKWKEMMEYMSHQIIGFQFCNEYSWWCYKEYLWCIRRSALQLQMLWCQWHQSICSSRVDLYLWYFDVAFIRQSHVPLEVPFSTHMSPCSTLSLWCCGAVPQWGPNPGSGWPWYGTHGQQLIQWLLNNMAANMAAMADDIFKHILLIKTTFLSSKFHWSLSE